MAKSKQTEIDPVEKLSGDVEALRADLGALVASLKDAGIAEGKDAVAATDAKTEHVQAQLVEAAELAKTSTQSVSNRVQSVMKEQPMAAFLVAAAAGVAVGMATAKK